ncbi:ABC transporter ATP-binding protein [Streptomyces eurocidicus]|uniref:ABC transporter ATP-binding protein n=1 Tax=Streptomyces eurocidicus TaxID=66423 RepID=A0A2N8NRE6_STREU|nr:ABC transporter ATP-binding protein [Streptomyces eurocidicus]MBB5117144.1 peptide/nickel transport system ATP-binding protein [Streptomyces eurocidicus]MBF6052562.1 oligopeptide ABC transporter ATP-binding protein OppD [Streptomyces eurocidicus]PNE31339.1 ABC transporter ATP-binding protein [Streptomyces eurocidicus]
MTAGTEPLVSVTDLSVAFPTGDGVVRAVDGLSFTLARGGALGIVGESGSGKSTAAYALLGLHRDTGAEVSGSVTVAGHDVLAAGDAELRALRGGVAAMVFQDPLSSLDPYQAIGDQIAEVYRTHRKDASRRAARERATEVLDRVGIPDAARRARSRPHEFSGGMRQRALIAMALACEPRLLVADEPTTALDVTVQAQILDLLRDLREETGTGLILVTHDLGVAAGTVDELLVMKDGRAVEHAPVRTVLDTPRETYTRDLLAAVPRLNVRRKVVAKRPVPSVEGAVEGSAEGAADTGVLLEAEGLTRTFGRGRKAVTAVEEVSLTVRAGETIGVVGESGSGKTTLGRMLVRLLEPTGGALRYRGRDIGGLKERELRAFRSELQMVFQDPVSSLNPRRSVGESIADPLRAAGRLGDAEIVARVRELLERVGLDPGAYHRYPHEFSGGQRQRVGIARALAPEPRLIVCDEPVSALDVTTQAQVVRLLGEIQRDLGVALVFIAHDLAVVRQVSDRLVVMKGGRIVEEGAADTLYERPGHPYTQGLLAAVPRLEKAEAAA